MSPSDAEGRAEASFYERIGGMPVVEGIVGRFYTSIADDDLLGPMYPSSDLADGSAERRLRLFLAQYWGGPQKYSAERGHPRLRMRHAPFVVDSAAIERWLLLFRAALDGAHLSPEHDAQFWGYVSYAAEFMRNSEG